MGRFGAGGKAMRMEQLMLTCKELPMVIARETTQAWWRPLVGALAAAWVFSVAAVSLAFGQASSRPCPPASERTDEPRPTCSTGSEKLGRLSDGPVFWHLDVYPTRAAAETAKGPRGTVIESLGKVWLFTIAEANWHPAAGVRIAKIGPLPVTPNVEYTAVYLEGIFDPGTMAPIHMHSGPEAFYTLTGDTCLETPDGVLTGRGDGMRSLCRAVRRCSWSPRVRRDVEGLHSSCMTHHNPRPRWSMIGRRKVYAKLNLEREMPFPTTGHALIAGSH